MREGEKVYYDDRPEVDKDTILALIFFILFTVVVIDIPLFIAFNLPFWTYLIELILISLLFLFFTSLLRVREVKVTGEELIIRFGFFTSRTPLDSIVEVDLKNPPLPVLASGIGYAFKYLVFAFNPTERFVRIKRRKGLGKDLYLNVNDIRSFISALNKAISQLDG